MEPPVAKYKYTLTITGNSHAEIQHELLVHAQGGYLIATDYETRDECHRVGGTYESVLEHTNPDQTAERYSAELDAWWQERKAARAER